MKKDYVVVDWNRESGEVLTVTKELDPAKKIYEWDGKLFYAFDWLRKLEKDNGKGN